MCEAFLRFFSLFCFSAAYSSFLVVLFSVNSSVAAAFVVAKIRGSIFANFIRFSLSVLQKNESYFSPKQNCTAICTPDKYPKSWTGEILAEKLGDAHSCLTLHLKYNVL
ncbi:hypothetical protein M9H77_13869 [Catharanthus roseus]|uniref:Uncharacterized protein n=1 Tax=Catharanthus roseus TaxID=4058 RepID=A0ACC0BLE4_CATRO|nr:hypothetical protein M9H77_13869 [Catharanthus roseus]